MRGLAADYPEDNCPVWASQQFTLFSLIHFSCITNRMRAGIYQTKTCICGCNEEFSARLSYRVRDESGKPTFPNYKRGHHPNCAKNNTANKPAWNAGLKKGDHPSLERMGFQAGHEAFCDWSHLHDLQRNDAEYRSRWLAAKKGQVAWNTGLTKDQYPNGIASGPDHGNWAGGYGGLRDTALYQDFRKSILKRDNYTCQECGDQNYRGRGSRCLLEVDHIEPVCVAPDRVMDPTNVRTLCVKCHLETPTYGGKARRYKERLIEDQGGSH